MLAVVRFFVISLEIARQLARYGLGRTWIALRGLPAEERTARTQRLRALCFADFFRNLGATFIKVGQILSSRPDLLEPYLIAELKLLQDQLPPFDFEHVERIFREDLGKGARELFERIEERPVAAASVAQVHEAWLKTGEHAAVKIRRPKVEVGMTRDLAVVRALAGLSDRLPYLRTLRLSPLAGVFADAIHSQLDLALEAKNCKRFRENFKDVDYARLPKVYDAYCSGRILTMEFLAGRHLEEVIADPPIDPKILAERLWIMYHEMAYSHYLMHADLHPGNVKFGDDGTIIVYDTGLVAEFPPKYIKRLLQLGLASTTMDPEIIVRAYVQGLSRNEYTQEQIDAAVADAARMVEEGKELYRKEKGITGEITQIPIGDIEFGELALECFAFLRRHKIYVEPELTMGIVADITIEGMAKRLDPDIDVFALAGRILPGYIMKLNLKPEELIPGLPGARPAISRPAQAAAK